MLKKERVMTYSVSSIECFFFVFRHEDRPCAIFNAFFNEDGFWCRGIKGSNWNYFEKFSYHILVEAVLRVKAGEMYLDDFIVLYQDMLSYCEHHYPNMLAE